MIQHVKSENGVHTFEIYENGILKERANVGANSKEEAQSILENRQAPNELENLRREKINSVRAEASNLLTATDYKVIRHRDQRDLEAKTTLTEVEYQELLNERDAIRNRSNELEKEINSLNIEGLNRFKLQ